MFNWLSLPTFAAMLLFWMLAAYVLTRSPRSAISATAAAAQAATAAYLLGQGMQANASNIAEWQPWARNLHWGATTAPALWYWLTLLLLAAQDAPRLGSYVRTVGRPLGVVLALASAAITVSIYVDDLLFLWSQVQRLPPERITYSQFDLRHGPVYPGFVVYLATATVGAAVNAYLAWRHGADPARRERFAWLAVSAVLFILGANSLGAVNWVTEGAVPTWIGHIALACAMVVMAWNVAAYSLLVRGPVLKTDFFYFLTTLVVVCVLYGSLLLFAGPNLAGPSYSFQLLALVVLTLTLAVLSHALVDIGRRALDALFFGSDVRRLRSNLSSVVQTAAFTDDLDQILDTAQTEIAEVSTERMIRLTEQALRRLNNPSALAACDLMNRLPSTVAEVCARTNGVAGARPTDLDRARALREVLVAAIEKLKPPETDVRRDNPAALQHLILREEYLEGLLNKQIMIRHAISEGTFHRNRRQAIASVARELRSREDHLTTAKIGTA